MILRKKIENEENNKEFIINKGAPVVNDLNIENEWIRITLRMPSDVKNKIKLSLKKRLGISINSWILESICEKFEKERANGKEI